MPNLSDSRPYYSNEAYDPNQISEQAEAVARGILHRMTGSRLPWGNTQEVVPIKILQDTNPQSMRFWERSKKEKEEKKANGTYVPAYFEGVELHSKHDHEVYRHSQLPFRSQFWLNLRGCGKWIAIILTPITMLSNLLMVSELEGSAWEHTSYLLTNLYSWLIGIPLACWAVGYIITEHFPKLWLRPPKGPLWELNRRTGKVKVFGYNKFKKEGKIEETEIPFHEFDAYIITSPDRQGLPMNGLALTHRYSDIGINFNDLITPDNTTQQPCALWDFLQNFMDVSRPLPDIPEHEPYRHLDPATAKYDKRIGREPRYWIDMDNDTFKAKIKEMHGLIDAIDTLRRPNLMAKYVKYLD